MNRILALILSLVYCGFGQIYKGEVLKGINFAVIYTALILSLVFLSSVSPLAQLILILLLILMWLIGVIDAYADEKTFIEGNHGLLWKTLIMVLIVFGISSSVVAVTILVVRPQVFTSGFGNITTHVAVDNKTKDLSQLKPMETENSSIGLQEDSLQNQMSNTQTSENIKENPIQVSNDPKNIGSDEIKKDAVSAAKYYTVQVGAFSESESAQDLLKQLKEKGYSVRVISPLPDESPALYKVQVGKFDNKDSAANLAEKLNKYEGIISAVVLLTDSD